jgi:hypothetical protein
VKPRLRPIFVLTPEPNARGELDAALDTLAEALAEQFIARARAEVCGSAPSPTRRQPTRDHRQAQPPQDGAAR